jgi:polysaccharide pyruvyl transferase WcaK-like protein
MDSSIKLIQKKPEFIFSSRVSLTDENIEKINTTKSLIVMGANTLKDNYEITPNFNLRILNKIKIPIILMGIGHYGVESVTSNGLDADSFSLVKEINNRFPYISVRCNYSYNYLKRSNINEQNILNTSCPVIYSVDEVNKQFSKSNQKVVVTITDRIHIDKQIGLFHFVKDNFKSSNLIASFHQNYNNNELDEYLKKLGFEIFKSEQYEDFIELYKDTDLHIGNRVHAHLKCLSLGVRSFLTPFDLRQLYFSESLDFPLINKLPDDILETYNFDNFKFKQSEYKLNMNKFINKVRELI